MSFWKVELSRRFTSYISRVSLEYESKFEAARAKESRPMVARDFPGLEKFRDFTKIVEDLVTGIADPQKVLIPFGVTSRGTAISTLEVGQWRGSFLVPPSQSRYLGTHVSETSVWERVVKTYDPFWENFP